MPTDHHRPGAPPLSAEIERHMNRMRNRLPANSPLLGDMDAIGRLLRTVDRLERFADSVVADHQPPPRPSAEVLPFRRPQS